PWAWGWATTRCRGTPQSPLARPLSHIDTPWGYLYIGAGPLTPTPSGGPRHRPIRPQLPMRPAWRSLLRAEDAAPPVQEPIAPIRPRAGRRHAARAVGPRPRARICRRDGKCGGDQGGKSRIELAGRPDQGKEPDRPRV